MKTTKKVFYCIGIALCAYAAPIKASISPDDFYTEAPKQEKKVSSEKSNWQEQLENIWKDKHHNKIQLTIQKCLKKLGCIEKEFKENNFSLKKKMTFKIGEVEILKIEKNEISEMKKESIIKLKKDAIRGAVTIFLRLMKKTWPVISCKKHKGFSLKMLHVKYKKLNISESKLLKKCKFNDSSPGFNTILKSELEKEYFDLYNYQQFEKKFSKEELDTLFSLEDLEKLNTKIKLRL